MHKINIDLDKCTSCQTCVKACFQNVFRWNNQKNIPEAAYPQDCHVCCLCEILCPVGAIKVTPDWQDTYWPPILAHKKR